jgi:hypothetical protein
MTSIFYMWSRRREGLIARHKFFVAEGKARLTDQFSDKDSLEKEANDYADQWLERVSSHFDPDRHDPGDFYDQASDERLEFFFGLDELGNSARLALISGMFHLWERSLREWLTSNDGIGTFQIGEALPRAIWQANFSQIFELLEHGGLFLNGSNIKETLDACRLVVNTFKHGKGSSLVQLKLRRPELFDRYGWRSQSQFAEYIEYADHADLYVGSEHIDEFSDAIVAFWEAIPEHITEAELKTAPKWFHDAHQKDCGGTSHAN